MPRGGLPLLVRDVRRHKAPSIERANRGSRAGVETAGLLADIDHPSYFAELF
jgi:hypothetical protein